MVFILSNACEVSWRARAWKCPIPCHRQANTPRRPGSPASRSPGFRLNFDYIPASGNCQDVRTSLRGAGTMREQVCNLLLFFWRLECGWNSRVQVRDAEPAKMQDREPVTDPRESRL